MKTIDCQTAEPSIYLNYDRELEPLDQMALDDHLEHCPECAQREQFISRLMGAVRKRCPRHSAPAALKNRILDALQEVISPS